jgi:hypothetical protein
MKSIDFNKKIKVFIYLINKKKIDIDLDLHHQLNNTSTEQNQITDKSIGGMK